MRLQNGAIDSWLLPSTSKMGEEDSGDEQDSEMEITSVFKMHLSVYMYMLKFNFFIMK